MSADPVVSSSDAHELVLDGHTRIFLRLPDESYREDGIALLREVDGRLRTSSIDEPIQFGFWSVVARRRDESSFELWEFVPGGGDIRSGADFTLMTARNQTAICLKHGSLMQSPSAWSLCAVPPSIWTAKAIDGIRYLPTSAMSGWWLTGENFDGNYGSVVPEHLYHVATTHPEVVPYLALAPGFAFDMASRKVWFEKEASETGN